MKIEEIKTGDTLLIRGTGFISNVICKVMEKWGKRNKYDTSKLYSHAGTFIWIAGELYVFGSIDSGYKPWLFKLHYDWDKDNYLIMRRNTELTLEESNKVTNYCLHLVTVSLLYQYWNFIQWLVLVYLKINLFKQDSPDYTYCYESTRMVRKDLDPDNYTEVYQSDLFQILYDKNYSIIFINNPLSSFNH